MPDRFFRQVFCLLILCMSGFAASAEVNSVYIVSRLDPNAIIITEVDVVFVYEQAIVDDFPATKTAWYSGKRQFAQEVGEAVDIVNVFVPQGFDSTMASLPARRSEALKVYVFAQHDDASIPPVDVTDIINVQIEIDPFGIRVSSRD